MYKIIDITGYEHKELLSFNEAIRKLRADMYISWHDVELASTADTYTFIYGFVQSSIEKV